MPRCRGNSVRLPVPPGTGCCNLSDTYFSLSRDFEGSILRPYRGGWLGYLLLQRVHGKVSRRYCLASYSQQDRALRQICCFSLQNRPKNTPAFRLVQSLAPSDNFGGWLSRGCVVGYPTGVVRLSLLNGLGRRGLVFLFLLNRMSKNMVWT